MKRLKLKITRNLKAIMVVSGLLGAVCFSVIHSKEATIRIATAVPFVGVAAGLKKSGKWDGLDDNTKAYIEQQDTVLKELHEGKMDIKSLNEAIKDYAEKNITTLTAEEKKTLKELEETVKKQATIIDQMKNRTVDGDAQGPIQKALKENDEKIKNFLKGGGGPKLEIEVKAAQVATDIETHTIGDYVPGIGQLPVRKPFIEDLFATINTTKEYIKYMDQKTVVRDAKNVAGCAASEHNTKLTWKEYSIQITKVRDFVDICQDMMDDYEFVEGEIRNLIETSVSLKVDNGLLLGDGVHPNLHSIDEASSEFSAANTLNDTIDPWEGTVQAPNVFDLVIAMASQIIALGQDNNYMPNVVLMNTVDKFKHMLIKDKNDNYLLPPFVAVVDNKEFVIDSMKVRSNPAVPANALYVFDSTKGKNYNRKGITIEFSYENNDNFETETVTVKAYRRLNLLIRNVDKNAFMKCSDVEAGLAALAKPANP